MNRSVLKRALEESHARSDATRIIKLSKTEAFVHHLPRSVRSFASVRFKHRKRVRNNRVRIMALSRHLRRKIFRILHTNTYTYNWARRASNTSYIKRFREDAEHNPFIALSFCDWIRLGILRSISGEIVLGGKKFKIEISSFVKNNISDTNEREPLNHHLAR